VFNGASGSSAVSSAAPNSPNPQTRELRFGILRWPMLSVMTDRGLRSSRSRPLIRGHLRVLQVHFNMGATPLPDTTMELNSWHRRLNGLLVLLYLYLALLAIWLFPLSAAVDKRDPVIYHVTLLFCVVFNEELYRSLWSFNLTAAFGGGVAVCR
jgi:hypothetical protein